MSTAEETKPVEASAATNDTAVSSGLSEETEHAVLRQIEYYFSEANFPKDKFLMAEVAKSSEGWVDLSVIANFNKVKSHIPSRDVAVLAAVAARQRPNFVIMLADDMGLVRCASRWRRSARPFTRAPLLSLSSLPV